MLSLFHGGLILGIGRDRIEFQGDPHNGLILIIIQLKNYPQLNKNILLCTTCCCLINIATFYGMSNASMGLLLSNKYLKFVNLFLCFLGWLGCPFKYIVVHKYVCATSPFKQVKCNSIDFPAIKNGVMTIQCIFMSAS